MMLYNCKVEKNYVVVEIKVQDSITRRLESLGINEGTMVQVLNKKRNGAMVIKVRGTRLALGKSIIEQITVKEPGDEGQN